MGKIARQRRNRLRMTLFNIVKSNKEKESQQILIMNLQKELSFQQSKHEDTVGFYKKGLYLQEGYFYLKYETVALNFKQQLIDKEATFHKSLLEMVHQAEFLKQKIFQLEKEKESLNIEIESPNLIGPVIPPLQPMPPPTKAPQNDPAIDQAPQNDSTIDQVPLYVSTMNQAPRNDSSAVLDSGQSSSAVLDSGQRSRRRRPDPPQLGPEPSECAQS